jgi:hypothetical protein
MPLSLTPGTSARTLRRSWRIGRFYLAVLTSPLVWSASAPVRDIGAEQATPRAGDHTQLSWREGPPYVTNFRPEDAAAARYSSDRRFLRLATGYYTADFDTEKIGTLGLVRHGTALDEEATTAATLAGESLPGASLRLEIRVGESTYVCAGRRRLALDSRSQVSQPQGFPVRIIESGRFFQKFAVHDLDFRDAAGHLLPVAARLEVAAWPDRFSLMLVGQPTQPLPPARVSIKLRQGDGPEQSSESVEDAWGPQLDLRTTLTVTSSGQPAPATEPEDVVVRVEPNDARFRATVRWTPEENSHSIQLEGAAWPEPAEGNYPEPMLDAWESYALTLENHSAAARPVSLSFDHTPVQSIICYVPMLLDARGNPTGLPVQVSKNWHQIPEGTELPYAGPWMHGRTWINVPAHSRLALRYGTTFARWGGVPTASLAQMALVGWGHNGFWTQFALGGFGESFCFQPARVMRRALLADLRPLYQRGFAKDERWAWTPNVGGGDTMVRLDAGGRYVPFKRNVSRFASHGPNLAHLVYDEIAVDNAVRSHVEVFLPRTDDCVRVFLRVRHEVLKAAAFSRLALFQLGADFYNETDAPLIAWGNAGGLVGEQRPPLKNGEPLGPTWTAQGDQPWLSLHGEERADRHDAGQASRGLIVREWNAVLGGRPVAGPTFAAVGSRVEKPRLAAEIVPPAGLTALAAGDHVDMLLELVALPLAAERYYGPDAVFRAALQRQANTWKLVHREAAANRPTLALPAGAGPDGWPLQVAIGDAAEVAFTLRGGLGWVPLRLTDLVRPDAVELYRITAAGRERVTQGAPNRPFWQCEYDSARGRWTNTYNLPASTEPAAYVAVTRPAGTD